MKYCGKCGQELDNKTKLCPQCDQTVLNKKKKIKKTVIAVIAVLCCISIISVGIFGALRFVNNDTTSYTYDEYNSFMEGFTDVLITDEKSAIEAVASVGDILGIKDAKTELEVTSINRVGNDCYYKLQQYYNGIEVYGNSISLAVDKDGQALGMISVFESIYDRINIKAKITDEEIVSSVNKYLDIDTLSINDIKENKLVIYKNESSKYVLANNLLIDGYGEFVLDTKTSEVLLFNDLVNPVAALVESKNKSAQAMGWKNDDGSHHLYNDQYKISVFDFDGIDSYPQNMDYKINYEDHGIDTIYSNNNVFEDEEAVRLLDQLIKISDFYKKLGFEGFDRIHAGINDGHQNGDNSLGCGGVENGVRFATIAMGECYNSSYYDVVAHEYTHGVTGLITNWSAGTSGSEAGAICEAYSDIFGVLIENTDSPDWTLGKENSYRDIASPILSYPEQCYTYVKEMKEGSKESHVCSTIISHCAYLMYHGIDNNEDLKIEGNKLAELFYRSLYMLSKNSTFSQCRSAVELSARIMCINGDMDENEYLCVRTAFAQAGISSSLYAYSKVLKNQFDLSVLGYEENEVEVKLDVYKTEVNNHLLFWKKSKKLIDSKMLTNGKDTLDLEDGEYILEITDIDDEDAESPISLRVVVDGQIKGATDEVVVYTDFTDVITVVLNEEPTKSPSDSSEAPSKLEYEMREEVIEFPLSDGTVYYSNTVKYPYFLGSSDVEKTINSRYSKYIRDFKDNDTDYDEVYESVKQWSDPNPPYYDDITAEVAYNKNGAISIKETAIMWSGGAHPYSTVNGITYDIKSGKELKWQDIIIGSDEAIDKKLKEALEKAVGYSVKGTMMQTLKESTGYSLCDKGLCFYYNVGDAVDRKNVVIEYTSKDSYLIKLDDSTSENSKELTEKDLKAKAEEHGMVSAWGYADYDGNGKKEAFAVITDDNSQILETVFISSDGTVKLMQNDLNWSLYKNDDGYIRYTNGKGFFWADMGAYGSGYSTIVYSVKNNSPYSLKISSDIQGFYQEGDILYTTKSEFLPEGGHVYPEYELVYDSSTQEFSVGNKIDID